MKSFQIETYAVEIKSGNRLAFSDFFRKNHDRFVRYALRFVNDKNDALDIVQDVFIKLWNNRNGINPEKSLIAYLYTSIRNQSLNFLRDHSTKTETIPVEELPDVIEQKPEESSLLADLKKCIDNLPDRQKEAFELSRFEGLQHDEIADIMEVSARTVNNHIVSALKTLRGQLQVIQRKAANE